MATIMSNYDDDRENRRRCRCPWLPYRSRADEPYFAKRASASVFVPIHHHMRLLFEDGHSDDISANFWRDTVNQENKEQPQQGDQNNEPGQQGQQPGQNPGQQQTQQPLQKPGQGASKT
jgi:hypothetical protein